MPDDEPGAMPAAGPPLRLLPRLDADNRFFWTSGSDGRLRFLRCNECATFVHPPAPVCPTCLSKDLEPEAVSGRGRVESFTLNVQQWIPGGDPYVIAWVSIDEQPDLRLTTNLVDIRPEDLSVGTPVEVVFEESDDVWLPLFRVASDSAVDVGVDVGADAGRKVDAGQEDLQ